MQNSTGSPADIEYPSEVFDLAFHPRAAIVAAATISGEVHVHEYSLKQNKLLFTVSSHTESCRACTFSDDGQALFTASADRSIQMLDMATGKAAATLSSAHGAAINALLNVGSQHILVSGDDNGVVKFWDLRQQEAIAEYSEHGDYITDLAACPEKKEVLASSGDGRITAMSFRSKKHKETLQSEDEPLSLAIVKGGKNIIAGTQEGMLDIYKWGEWDDCLDRVTGHPQSVDTIVALDENTICTGSSDGLIRRVSVLPHNLQGVVGMHDGFPVEKLAVSGDKTYLGSCSHDKLLKFWRIDEMKPVQPDKIPAFGVADADGVAAAAAAEEFSDDDDEEWEDEEMDMEDQNGFDYGGAAGAGAGSGGFLSDL